MRKSCRRVRVALAGLLGNSDKRIVTGAVSRHDSGLAHDVGTLAILQRHGFCKGACYQRKLSDAGHGLLERYGRTSRILVSCLL